MLKRSLGSRELHWVSALFPVLILLLSPWNMVPAHMVSLCALLPSVYLVTGWHRSGSRAGLMGLLFRTDSAGGVKVSEIAFPAIAGTVLSSAAALALGWPPLWQFWITAPLTALSFSLILSVTEEKLKFPGRYALGLLWIWGISRPSNASMNGGILVATDYPGRVLFASPESGGTHPDSFVLASLILVLIAFGSYSLPGRK